MRLNILVAAVILFVGARAARADSIETFDLSGNGTVTDSPYLGLPSLALAEGVAEGSMTVDTTTGMILSLQVDCSDGSFGTSVAMQNLDPIAASYELGDSVTDYYSLSIDNDDPLATSFLGFSGGTFTIVDDAQHGGEPYGRIFQSYSGTVVPAAALTPEPSSSVLLGTGLLGIAGILRRRRM